MTDIRLSRPALGAVLASWLVTVTEVMTVRDLLVVAVAATVTVTVTLMNASSSETLCEMCAPTWCSGGCDNAHSGCQLQPGQ
jgi:hypothetical protein